MSLAQVKRTYEMFGREDPLYAILSVNRFRHNRWNRDEFFHTGQQEIAEVLAYVEGLGVQPQHGRALDFGCGVGRLSQALAGSFGQVVGVDIAESMVERARSYNAHGGRVEYRVNATDDLKCFANDSFDFLYSNITLQHIPPEASSRYIREFVRVLRPGGVGVFQIPSGAPYRPGSLGAMLYRIRRHHLRRFWKIVRGRHPVEIHYVPRKEVERLVAQSGGRILNVVDVHRHRREENFRYCFAKE